MPLTFAGLLLSAWTVLEANPVVVRGAPTALAVQTDDPAAPPPTVLVDGVPWPYRLATVVPVGETTWESELQPTRVRPTSPDDEVRLPRLLLLTVPESGTLQVEDTIIEPVRFPKPARWSRVPPPDVPRPPLDLATSPGGPDPQDPLAWWRLALMADQADTTAQLPSNWTPEAKQAAQALAARWRAALALVAGEDPGIAASLRSALTNAVRDTSGRVRAAWMDGSTLLPKLLAPTNADQVSQIALEALDAWIPLGCWTTVGEDGLPRLAGWHGGWENRLIEIDGLSERLEIPRRCHFELSLPVGLGGMQTTLRAGAGVRTVQFPNAVGQITPPAFRFNAPRPAPRLFGVQSSGLPFAAECRVHNETPEIFVTCVTEPESPLQQDALWFQLDEQGILVSANGPLPNVEGVVIHRRVWLDRWHVRLECQSPPSSLSIRRTHEGGGPIAVPGPADAFGLNDPRLKLNWGAWNPDGVPSPNPAGSIQ